MLSFSTILGIVELGAVILTGPSSVRLSPCSKPEVIDLFLPFHQFEEAIHSLFFLSKPQFCQAISC